MDTDSGIEQTCEVGGGCDYCRLCGDSAIAADGNHSPSPARWLGSSSYLLLAREGRSPLRPKARRTVGIWR